MIYDTNKIYDKNLWLELSTDNNNEDNNIRWTIHDCIRLFGINVKWATNKVYRKLMFGLLSYTKDLYLVIALNLILLQSADFRWNPHKI